MLLRIITGLLLSAGLMLNAYAAEEKDAPLPFDDPASATALPKKPAKKKNVVVRKKTSTLQKGAKTAQPKPKVATTIKKPAPRKVPSQPVRKKPN